jgi:5-formyltetrahydrofolate cyclo-ligase
MSENKSSIRKQLKILRNNFDADELKKKSAILQKQVVDSAEFKEAKSVFCYIAFGKEIGTSVILNECLTGGKILSVPLITGRHKMISCRLDDMKNLRKNSFGIMEPADIMEVPADEIDLVVVPALGYNKDGYRIGFGGGFYDNYLKDFSGISVGMMLKEFMLDFRPDSHDIAVKKLFIL